MATNFFFNNFESSQEQLLIEDLVIESIKIYGHDVFYCPRKIRQKDEVFNEDALSYFDTSYMMEMYIKNVQGFEGDGDFLSKFNLEIRDQVTFTIARRVFANEAGATEAMVRPNEGDIIFFPLNRKIFQVKFVEHESMFYQLGALQTFDLICELWEYSGEDLNTGIPDIDNVKFDHSVVLTDYALLTEDSNPYFLLDEDGFRIVNENYSLDEIDETADNEVFETEADSFIDFSEIDPFSEGRV